MGLPEWRRAAVRTHPRHSDADQRSGRAAARGSQRRAGLIAHQPLSSLTGANRRRRRLP
ncbi:hypothetical protein F01_420941 [Burkholderia cenocepacia]|nr:hypothetical protein F01_420941 [Burkholderia cenocepacia]